MIFSQRKQASINILRSVTIAGNMIIGALVDLGANKDELKAKLDEIEAEFSDDPAYLALIRTELKAKVK